MKKILFAAFLAVFLLSTPFVVAEGIAVGGSTITVEIPVPSDQVDTIVVLLERDDDGHWDIVQQENSIKPASNQNKVMLWFVVVGFVVLLLIVAQKHDKDDIDEAQEWLAAYGDALEDNVIPKDK